MRDVVTAKLQKALEGNLKDYKSIPFWSWNGELEETELVRQIEEMHAAGFGGFIMHARSGLKTEYLGEKWFSCIDACLKKAKQLDMNAWVYDENGYPSGFVGGELLKTEEYRAPFLRYKIKDEFDSSALCTFKKTADGFIRIYEAETAVTEYHCVYMLLSPANTDILNPKVVDEFIRLTHEEYYKRFSESFGKELVGFFTDEPQVYRYETPYSPVVKDEYQKRYGENVDDWLVYLFVHDERGYPFRIRYYTLMNELYTVNFYKRLYDWCDAHHCKLTGHSVEETSLYTQMWGGCGVMPSYEYEHIPAIDCLEKKCWTELLPKQVGSVAAQLGLKTVLTETFGCAGHDATPKELKSIAEFQYFQGVNLMCQHLFPYTLAAQGKFDCPPVFSSHGNWGIEETKIFNDYFTRLGYLIANTKEEYDVLVIHPLRSVYLDYIRSEDEASVEEIERSFKELLQELRVHGICYHFADERILERYGSVVGDRIVVGQCAYDAVILPEMPTIASNTYALLKEYKGKLFLKKTPAYVDGVKTEVTLSSNITMDGLRATAKYAFESTDGKCGLSARSGEIGEYLFLMNYSLSESSKVKMRGIAENYAALNLETFELSPIDNEMTLGAGEGLILLKARAEKKRTIACATEDITADFSVSDVTDNYFVLDKAAYSLDGAHYSQEQFMQKFIEKILRDDYKGKLYIRHTFKAFGRPKTSLVVEKNRFLSHTVNGKNVTFSQSAYDVNFLEGDITAFLKDGENEFTYCLDYYQNPNVRFALFDPMSNPSVLTCLYYDTDVEYSYLKGEFTVREDMAIEARKQMPTITSDVKLTGYPFFLGKMTLKGIYFYNGDGERDLELDGRFLVANVRINGVKTNFVLNTKKDISPLLKKGENEIEIELKSSLRNLFGPHHWNFDKEPTGVSMGIFTMRGHWGDGDLPFYTPDYKLVPFGLDKIWMISKK
ncbi:MAG: hypothetical protein IJ506_00685 [Clostridia bacterium]|nr:hypothetical protein [Clostridia bacterium]